MNKGASSKTALVLAGGGLTGAVYEIGALRAVDDLLVGRTVNDFDIYVGTSAGALVTSMLANGLSPEEMLRSIAHDHPTIPPITSDARSDGVYVRQVPAGGANRNDVSSSRASRKSASA